MVRKTSFDPWTGNSRGCGVGPFRLKSNMTETGWVDDGELYRNHMASWTNAEVLDVVRGCKIKSMLALLRVEEFFDISRWSFIMRVCLKGKTWYQTPSLGLVAVVQRILNGKAKRERQMKLLLGKQGNSELKEIQKGSESRSSHIKRSSDG